MVSLAQLISEASAGDGRSPANSISKPNVLVIVPIEGDQLPLPLTEAKAKRRLWLQIQQGHLLYTYDESAKAFVSNSWNAMHYPTLGRARAARFALGKHKQLKQGGEFNGCELLIYDADLGKVVDPEPAPAPPEPVDRFPLCDNAPDRLPWCPECGALMLAPCVDCPTCDWTAEPTPNPQPPTPTPNLQPSAFSLQPQIDALKQRRSQLMSQVDGIRRAGAVAPKGCSVEPYYVSKDLSNGKKERFKYFRVKSEGEALFQNKHGQATKSLHLGTETSPACKDWRERVQRRNAIAQLERDLDKAERKLQKLQNKATSAKP